MTISLEVRVPKVTEDDILFNTPLPENEDIVWVWKRKGFRASDIANVEVFSKSASIVTYWDHEADGFRKLMVKEAFQDVMLKWEIAECSAAVFEEEEEPAEEEDLNLGEGE